MMHSEVQKKGVSNLNIGLWKTITQELRANCVILCVYRYRLRISQINTHFSRSHKPCPVFLCIICLAPGKSKHLLDPLHHRKECNKNEETQKLVWLDKGLWLCTEETTAARRCALQGGFRQKRRTMIVDPNYALMFNSPGTQNICFIADRGGQARFVAEP